MKKLVFFSMLFLASIVTQAQTTYGGQSGGDAGQTGSITSSFFGIGAGMNSNSPTGVNTFIGTDAGRDNTTGYKNTFLGGYAGVNNTGGRENVFLGVAAGSDNLGGRYNVFVGAAAGRKNEGGAAHYNTYLGYQAGFSNVEGAGNVCLGNKAGYNEMGSNRLYIHNNDDSNPLIEGTFNTRRLTFNGTVGVGNDVPAPSMTVPDIQLYVDGRFTQKVVGNIGAFTPGNRWSSLGDSFAPTTSGTIPNIYGMLNQGYGATFISGSQDDGNNVIAWSGTRLNFDFIENIPTMPPTIETAMFINEEGKVAIGGDAVPTPGNYKLYVKDGILTEKVRVENCVDWADYVFEEDYERNTTEEVEQFVKENKHLPNVPSAKEVSENGIDVAEMDATLLRQIEELWLHVIDLKKDNETLKNKVENLQK